MRVVKVPEPTYTLEGLTSYEAGVILKVCDNVGGSPDGPRGVIEELSNALSLAGAKVAGKVTVSRDKGGIYLEGTK